MTGRDRIVKNTLWSWGGHLVFIVAGFVMPRMIDSHVGQVSLGIWDFSWSLVSYFGLAGLGVGSSVNRYVAKLRAAGDTEGLNMAVTSVVYVQAAVGVAVGIMTLGAVAALPALFRARLGAELPNATWVVGFLGMSLAVQMAFDTNRGIITGCHRWDLHNAINSVSYGLTVVGMVAALSAGGGLRAIGAVYLAVGIVTEIYRYRAARRICPELRIERRYASWKQAGTMVNYGLKSVVAGLSPLILVQGSSLLIVSHLGPAALAVFSRPSGLIRNGLVFVNKYAMILTPTAGSLQGVGLQDEIRKLFYRTTRYTVAMALPIVLFLSIQGEHLLRIWMGPRYSAGLLMFILSAGAFLPMCLQPALNILAGLNAHGPIGRLTVVLTAALMAVGVGWMAVAGWSLTGSAIMVSAVFTLVNGVALLVYICRKLEVPLADCVRQCFAGPILASVPYALFLWGVRDLLDDRPLLSVLAGCAGTIAILGPIYWKYMLGPEMRARIREKAAGIWVPKAAKAD